MKFTYPAIIRKQDNGTWKAWLPDLACCEAVGDTLDDAIEEVNAAVYDWISLELSEDEADLPPVSDMDDLDTIEGDVTRNICVNIRLFDGWDESVQNKSSNFIPFSKLSNCVLIVCFAASS